jgi:anthranilate phosphoribosyltransferase
VISGQRQDAARTLVLANAAAALRVGGAAESLCRGREMAEESIDNGAAMMKLDELVRLTNQTD